MNLLIENAKQVVTCASGGQKFKSGKYQSDIGLLENHSIYIKDGVINWIGKKCPKEIRKNSHKKINAAGKVIFPGFIDSHTHYVFAGDRADEYSMRMRGMTYEQIASAGGGIIKTVEAVRAASRKQLIKLTQNRIDKAIEFGITSLEIKSGYGLDLDNEVKMLEIIRELDKINRIEIFPTFLGAHTFPKGITRRDYIENILYEMIPYIAKKKLALYIDVFCEENYFSPEEAGEILAQGIRFGLIPKVHTNQFHSTGGILMAVKHHAISVDHLEVMTETDISSLCNINIIACLLPGVSYFIDIPYAPARKLISKNVPLALATDFNPGSCMTNNIQLIMSLAVHKMGMSIEETINAVTINAAASLGISHRVGSIEKGKQADMLIFDTNDYRNIFYHFGVNQLDTVIKFGKVIH